MSHIHQHARKPLAIAILGATLALHAGFIQPLLSDASKAHAEEAVKTYAIAAGTLGAVLSRFANEAGVVLSFDAALTNGKQSPGLQGSYSVEHGFAQLLAGSGLQAVTSGVGGFSIVPAGDALSLSPSIVSAQFAVESAWSPVDGYVARRTSTGTKIDTPFLENPQAVSVITRDRMDDIGSPTLADSLRYTAGVNPTNAIASTGGDTLSLRGHDVSFTYKDGLRLRPTGFFGIFSEEPYGLERVEVLKGPTSILYGQSAPGGMINTVSKRPTDYERGEVGISLGSNSRRQLSLDVSGPLDEAGTLSYRLVALGREADGYMDHTDDDRAYIAPSLTWKPNEQTSLTILTAYQKNKALAPTNFPYAAFDGTSPYGRIPMDRFIGEPGFDFEEVESTSLGYEFTHVFDDTWTFRQNLRWVDIDNQENYLARVSGLVTGADGVPNASVNRNYQLRHAYGNHLGVDNQLQANFVTGPIAHTLLLGIDYSWSKSIRDEKWGTATPINIFNPVYGAPVDTSVYTSWVNTVQRNDQMGYYFQDQLKWDRWVLTLGGRQDRARNRTEDRWTDIETADQDWDAFTGRVGLVYLFDNGFAPYVSYSESFNPVVGTTSPARGSKPFEPETGKQYEAGVRYQPTGSDTQITLSVYDLRRQNATTADPQDTTYRYMVQAGETRSKGVELEAIATLAEGLKVTSSLSYVDVQVTKSNSGDEGNRPFKVPAKLASVWLDYSLPFDPLQGLSVGVGARYTGASYGDSANTFQVPSRTLYDAAVRYDLGRLDSSLQGIHTSLNVNNLTNEYYVNGCFFFAGCNPGAGRSVIAEVGYKW